jgi:2-polyprenyl-3-methyl-5-hydroxy-6-metoxy-1,4-benzoquinol methylase
MTEAEAFWEDFYGRERRWSGKPNASLVEVAAELEPGTALDVGCGEGGDAIWLASQGWQVTGTDISQTALDVAARHAAEAGVTVTWERHDLSVSQPAGPFDLVTTSFLHSKVELPRGRILRAAAEAVAPGGTLLVVGHAPSVEHRHADLPGLDEVIAELALPDERWQLVTSGLRERGDRVDTLVRFRLR